MNDRLDDPANASAEAAGLSRAFNDRLMVLRQRFSDRARQDAAAIHALRARARPGEPFPDDVARQLRHLAHGLSGAAGIFGFSAVGDAAYRVEQGFDCPNEPRCNLEQALDALAVELTAFD